MAAVMLAGSLAGCAGGGTTAAPETQAQTQAEAAKTEAEKTEAEKTEEAAGERRKLQLKNKGDWGNPQIHTV